MTSKRYIEASKLISKVVEEVFDDELLVSSILTKCLGIAQILDNKNDMEWISRELEGYKTYEPTGGSTIAPYPLPDYRIVTLLASLAKSSKHSSSGYPTSWHDYAPQWPKEMVFWIAEPVGHLESVREIELKRTIVERVGKRSFAYVMFSELSEGAIRGILSAVRAKAHRFLMQSRITVEFGPILEHLFESSKELIIQRFSDVDSDLLDEILSMLEKQQMGTTELDWRSALDACRNVLQRFTELLHTEDVIGNSDIEFKEDDTVGKTSLVVTYIQKELGKKKSRIQTEFILKKLELLMPYFSSLKATVERAKHKPTTRGSTITKDEADRVVSYVFLWIAEVVSLLDQTGFDWEKCKQVPRTQ
ncbi:MAG: AbiTii domain-containing protein [Candidatus Thorarchaeota archaeon]|jgi:hypothetical protein